MKKSKRNRQEYIYALALAGLSAALSLLLVWLAVAVRIGSLGFFAAAGIALMVPATKKYYISSVFAYVVSSVTAFFIVGDIASIAGYVVYFAPMSILTAVFTEKKIKPYISIPIKLVLINGALALLYFVFGTIMVDESVIEQLHYAVIAVAGTIILLAIDFVMQGVFINLKKIVGRVLRDKRDDGDGEDARVTVLNDDDDPFEGDSPFSE